MRTTSIDRPPARGGDVHRYGRTETGLGLALAATLALAAVARAQPLCPITSPAPGGHWAATSGCCSALSPALNCSSVSPALQGGKRNVVVVVEDDFGHCMSGFMGGRCARPSQPCEGKVCS